MDYQSPSSTPWLVRFNNSHQVRMRLFCFHYGGGSASAFQNWIEFLPPSVEIIAIQLPGREGRFNDAFVTEFDTLTNILIDVTRPYLDKPFVVFGHSLGTIVSFEWVRALQKNQLQHPLLYIPSGMQAPQFPDKDPPVSCLPEVEFVEKLTLDYGATLENILKQKELREVFLPQLRADFTLLESYKYVDAAPFECPILAIAGDEEFDITDKLLDGWREQTSSQFQSVRFRGDHFFIHSSQKEVLEKINFEIASIIKRLPENLKVPSN